MIYKARIARLLRRADEARDRGDWQAARVSYGAIVKLAPRHAAAWMQLGHAHKESGDLQLALQAYKQSRSLSPADPDVYVQLGHAFKLLGNPAAARENYHRALDLAPGYGPAEAELSSPQQMALRLEDPVAGLGLEMATATLRGADLARDAGEWELAADRYHAVLQAPDARTDLHLQLGHALKHLNRPSDAADAYRRVIDAGLEPGEAWLQLGHLRKDASRFAEARAAYLAATAAPSTNARSGALHELRHLLDKLTNLRKRTGVDLDFERPLWIIRGDIRSNTGYAKSARAVATLLSKYVPIAGVSIHENIDDCEETFPAPLLCDDDVIDLSAVVPVTVLHYTSPDHILPYPMATNICAFYWETLEIPRMESWPEMLGFVDAVWAPTSFIANVVRRCGYTGPVHVVSWPHQFDRTTARIQSNEINCEAYWRMPLFEDDQPGSIDFAELRRQASQIYLSIQSIAPRKGLPILLSEWFQHVAECPDHQDVLVLKLSFLHARSNCSSLYKTLKALGVRPGQTLRLVLIDDRLTDGQILSLIASADAYLSATLGEGFGGPVAESLTVGTPVIAPRHTGLADLLPPDYPFQIATSRKVVELSGNVAIYPHGASWHLPEPGSIRQAVAAFYETPASARRTACAAAVAYAKGHCSYRAVEDQLTTALTLQGTSVA